MPKPKIIPDDKTCAGIAPDAETAVVPPLTEAGPTLLAYSDDDEDRDAAEDDDTPVGGVPWPLVTGIAAAVLVITALVAIVIGLVGRAAPTASHDVAAPSAAPEVPYSASAPTAAVPVGPVLDGAYQITLDAATATYHGGGTPPKRTGIKTIWWAFRSSCMPLGGCTAAAVKLDDADHSIRSAKNLTDTFTFTDGQWVDGAIALPNMNNLPGCTNDSNQWTLQPRDDRTLTGVETGVIEGSCASAGNTTITPFTMTRIGPVPAGVFA